MSDLDETRKIINQVDEKMAELFCLRMKASGQVAEYKRSHGLQITDEAREKALIEKNLAAFDAPEYEAYYLNFIKNNIELSKSYQRKLLEGVRVAYSGVEGAFANIAAKRIFPECNAVPYPDFKNAYISVENGECDSVILPIENSFAGDVDQVMDLTFFGSLYINGIYELDVIHNLLGVEGSDIGSIKEVISHPQALSQCDRYIKKHGFKAVSATNTAVAAKTVADLNDPSVAAIGSEETVELYGLKKLEGKINDSNVNTTRFAVFSKVKNIIDRDSGQFIMLFTVKNEAGALGKAVSIIGQNGFNLKALKSRPTKELIWDYYFYVEGEGDIYGDSGKKMLDELSAVCSNLKLVGSF